MNTLNENKLFIDLLGLVETETNYFYIPEFGRAFRLGDFKFDSDWNWIMLAVDKIESIETKYQFGTDYFDFHIMPDAIIVRKQSDENNPIILINKSEGMGSIEQCPQLFEYKLPSLYKAVVLFIEWYNAQNEGE